MICIYRTRKNIIPNSRNIKIKNKKGLFAPFMMKECQKYFTEKRNKIYINNFYIQRQKIFDILLDKDNDDITKDDKGMISTSSNKMKISNTQTDFSVQIKEDLKNKLEQDINKINKKTQTFVPILKLEKSDKKKIRNKDGFIDFLCLDNWEEKENFKKRYLSENNKNQ